MISCRDCASKRDDDVQTFNKQEIWYYLRVSHIKWRELGRSNRLTKLLFFFFSFLLERLPRLNQKLRKLDKSRYSFRSNYYQVLGFSSVIRYLIGMIELRNL